jgi:predicted ATPase
LDIETTLELTIAYLSSIISIRVKDDLLQGISPEKRRRQTFDALRANFVGESQTKPVVVILEDIHWIDQTSEEFLVYLSSSVATNRIMILALHRPFYQCPWAKGSSYQQISIGRLSHREGEEMLHHILGVQEVAAEVKDLVQRKAEGNPFFMEELILELLESGLMRKEGKACRLVDQAANPSVPATVQDVIMARIDRLEDSCKHTLQLASVIGREFVFSILEKIAEPAHKLGPALQALQQSELITEKNLFPEIEYMFKHALTQDVTYNSLLLKQRRMLHTQIAAAIEEIKNDVLEEHFETLAYHYKNGDRPEKAFEFLVKAGEKAIEFSSVEVAKGYFTEALEISPGLTKPEAIREREQAVRSQLQRLAAH